jgi:hypothetical protein
MTEGCASGDSRKMYAGMGVDDVRPVVTGAIIDAQALEVRPGLPADRAQAGAKGGPGVAKGQNDADSGCGAARVAPCDVGLGV